MTRPADPARPDIYARITNQIIDQLEAIRTYCSITDVRLNALCLKVVTILNDALDRRLACVGKASPNVIVRL